MRIMLGISLIAGYGGSSSGYTPTRYVSAAGSDAADGLTPQTAWQTITKVNAATLTATDVIAFRGGDTFTGSLQCAGGSALSNIVYTSYGVGRAKIQPSDAVTDAIDIYNKEYITIDGFELIGFAGHPSIGMEIGTDNAVATKYHNVRIRNLIIHGFDNGLLIGCDAAAAKSGFSGLNVFNVEIYDCNTPMYSYGNANIDCHDTFNISYVYAHDNLMEGIKFSKVDGGTIQYCEAARNCGSGAGGVGMWAFLAKNLIFQYNESHHNATSGTDGGGFDLDGGCVDCIMQYNYSHDNVGSGFLLFAYAGTTTSGNIVRYNVSKNDATAVALDATRAGIQITALADMTGAQVYNNTVYQTLANPGTCMTFYAANGITMAAQVGNNLFYSTNGARFFQRVTSTGTYTLSILGNCYYNTGAFEIDWSGTAYTTLAGWQTATGLEKISGSSVALAADPQLVNPAAAGTMHGWNLPLLVGTIMPAVASPVLTGGVNLATQFGITLPANDILGVANPTNAIGAAQYQTAISPPAPSYLLMETGDFLLLESGSKILLEA